MASNVGDNTGGRICRDWAEGALKLLAKLLLESIIELPTFVLGRQERAVLCFFGNQRVGRSAGHTTHYRNGLVGYTLTYQLSRVFCFLVPFCSKTRLPIDLSGIMCCVIVSSMENHSSKSVPAK